VAGGQNALEWSEMHCLKMYFAHRAQLNAHVRPIETKMAVGRENDEYDVFHLELRVISQVNLKYTMTPAMPICSQC
jgi:hypothetical protein